MDTQSLHVNESFSSRFSCFVSFSVAFCLISVISPAIGYLDMLEWNNILQYSYPIYDDVRRLAESLLFYPSDFLCQL